MGYALGRSFLLPPTVLELKDLSFLVSAKPSELVLLGDVSAKIPSGEFVAVVGPSGCGKSTLLKLIAGICEPTFGEVFWNGRNLETEGDFEPHEIGYVPQFSIAYELLTVEENLDAVLRLRVKGLGAEARRERAASILRQVGLESIVDRPVRVLSGGQRRRLALALEMTTAPSLLLCDEVTSGLDPKAEDELVALLRTLSRENCRTVLSVTHSLRHLSAYDAVLVLHSGHLAYYGPPEHLTHYFQIREPADLYPQLALRSPGEWHRSWRKHYKAFARGEAWRGQPDFSQEEAEEPQDLQKPEEPKLKTDGKKVLRKGREDDTAEESAEKSDEKSDEKAAQKVDEKSDEKPEAHPAAPSPGGTPGFFSQFQTLLARRWRLFFRDPSAFWLQLALILGFPCLVVIFALGGLPQMQNLSLQHTGDIIKMLKENTEFFAQSSRVGSLVSGLVMFQVILLTLMASNNAAREVAGERLIFEKEKFGGLNAAAYVAAKTVFLMVLVFVQSFWMTLFVKVICGFPGDPLAQFATLALVNAAMTAVCLAISSFARSAEQASLISIYLVGFQLPLSGAVLALPAFADALTRPFIAAYWGWSGYLQSLIDTRFYEAVLTISQTKLSHAALCFFVLIAQVLVGLFLALAGCRNSRWPE